MALKYKFKSKEEVPAEHLTLYTERDGAWVLDVEGAVEKAKLDEFRNTNIALSKERDELKQRFDGIDAEEARALLADKQKAEEEKLLNGSAQPGALPNAATENAEKERAVTVVKFASLAEYLSLTLDVVPQGYREGLGGCGTL